LEGELARRGRPEGSRAKSDDQRDWDELKSIADAPHPPRRAWGSCTSLPGVNLQLLGEPGGVDFASSPLDDPCRNVRPDFDLPPAACCALKVLDAARNPSGDGIVLFGQLRQKPRKEQHILELVWRPPARDRGSRRSPRRSLKRVQHASNNLRAAKFRSLAPATLELD
jgi:hypothetical protein